MSVREYIGARYVPLFMGTWDDTKTYEPLSIVLYQGNSYTSRQSVPAGIQLDDETYWAETGNYNAQVEAYRQEVLSYVDTLDDVKGHSLRTYETVSDMVSDSDIANYEFARTVMYHAGTNYGGCLYIITDESVNAASLQCYGNCYATPVFESNVICISQLGAQNNTDSTDAIQMAFDVAYNGCEVLFDVIKPIVNSQIKLDVSDVTLKSVSKIYEYITTNVQNDYAVLINGHGCIMDDMHFKNGRADSITQITPGDKCMRIVDLTLDDFYNIDCQIRNCTFIHYDNCITAYGKNCKVFNCIFSNSINGVNLLGTYNGVDTPQRRGLVVSDCVFHGGDVSFTADVPYDEVRTVGVKISGGYREAVIENCRFNSSFYGYMFKGAGGGLTIQNNSTEDHTGAVGLAIITPREVDVNTHVCTVCNNKLQGYASANNSTISHPFVWNSSEMLVFKDNVLHSYTAMCIMRKFVASILLSGNVFFALANKYGDGLLQMEDQTANRSVALTGNLFQGGTGTMPLFYSNNTYTLSAVNSNYLDCNYINTNHFTV